MGKRVVVRGKVKAEKNAQEGAGIETLRIEVFPYVKPSFTKEDSPKVKEEKMKADSAIRQKIANTVLDDMQAFRLTCKKLAAVRCVIEAATGTLEKKVVKEKVEEEPGVQNPEAGTEKERKTEKKKREYMALMAGMEEIRARREVLLSDLQRRSFDYTYANELLKATGKEWFVSHGFSEEWLLERGITQEWLAEHGVTREPGREFLADQGLVASTFVDDWWKHANQSWGSKGVKTSNGWALLNNSANPPQFKFAPFVFSNRSFVLEEYGITLTWIKGQPVKFKFKSKRLKSGKTSMDGYIRGRVKAMLDGTLEPRTVFLHERDNRFYIRITYKYKKIKDREIDPEKVMEVAFDPGNPEEFFKLSPARKDCGEKKLDLLIHRELSVLAALAHIDRFREMEETYQKQQRSCGNRGGFNRGEGHRKAFDSLSVKRNRVAAARANSVRTWNHVWSKRIVETARYWKCGVVKVIGVPDGKVTDSKGNPIPDAGLCGRPWGWGDFKTLLKDKAGKYNLAVLFEKGVTVADLQKQLQPVEVEAEEEVEVNG